MNTSQTDPTQVYLRMQIGTASHQRLVCMLHEQCSLQLRQALEIDPSLRRPPLDRVQNMLVLLQRSLKPADATAKGLFHLYDYCYCLLEHDTATELIHARGIIDTLRQTFDQLRRHP
ncbi:MAG: flagellar protein FliS [Chitinispirillaceae bacterium]|nr:flagellar protein FliS [Chitinispirillaceae bacterium]